MKLPRRLKTIPIVEAVVEVRFNAHVSAASVLPGLLFNSLAGEKKIEKLPGGELPEALRQIDPNLRYSPHLRMLWTDFIILVGDHSIGIACNLPYPGWTRFKAAILQVCQLTAETGIITAFERYSMKYTNLIDKDFGAPTDVINFKLKIGSHAIEDESFQVRTEIKRGPMIHIVQLASSATANLVDGAQKTGTMIDVDSVVQMEPAQPDQFLIDLSEKFEMLHTETKSMFFSCLSKKALEMMGPKYD